jgi:hypothetical protein
MTAGVRAAPRFSGTLVFVIRISDAIGGRSDELEERLGALTGDSSGRLADRWSRVTTPERSQRARASDAASIERYRCTPAGKRRGPRRRARRRLFAGTSNPKGDGGGK